MTPVLQFQRRVIDDIEIGGQMLCLVTPSITTTHEMAQLLFDAELFEALRRLVPLFAGSTDAVAAQHEPDDAVAQSTAGQSGLAWMLEHASGLLAVFEQAAVPILCDKAGALAVIALDHRENRRRLAADPTFVEEFGNPCELAQVPGGAPGEDLYSPALRRWVRGELAVDHAIALVLVMRELINWGQLGKAIGTLLPPAPESVPEATAVPEIPSHPA